ncbi:glycosyltransferase family 39 protein [Mycolicibacterium hodleri]|uniref:Glycosyl transferase n=1 Tax=Mycolicibacterium hodleri TaxID=49897 RepID=A0A502DT07_9MYCO|nr:glycosyltransferase family 39 protein [Mycolicibacterium hodleri]TPG28174.1 glycosyl transferase [Mycolicibacterium hodleri]
MYLWDLAASDYGNAFYAAAAQAGSQSWSAWFFGSLDARNFITVDKPPASLWVTGLSVRLFGMNSWSVLVPQAVMGVTAVAVLFAAVRRVVSHPDQGAVAGLIAGAVLAGTPAAALMFRFNNPDALLVLLLVVAAYGLARAVQVASWPWLTLVGVVLGTAFLTKMLQGFLVLPGFGLAYLTAAPTAWRNRLLHLTGALAALVVSAGWWVLAVQLTPATARPYIGGSTDNSVLNLAFGYNGLGRLEGHESDWGAATVGARNTSTGLHRLFTTEMGNEISWLLPVALLAVAFGGYLAARGRLGRDEWAALLSWGGWLLVTVLVFSYMQGTIHPYYTVALAPAIGALVGLSTLWAWRLRAGWDGRIAMAVLLGVGGWWSSVLLRHNHFGPVWLPTALLLITLTGALSVAVGRRWWMATGLIAGASAAAAGTVAFTVATVATPHHGAIPNAVSLLRPAPGLAERVAAGGWTGDEATNGQLAKMLTTTTTPWSAATNGSQSAAALELATRTSVMAIGGWSGDPTPTLAQFIDDVHAGRVAYYVEAGRGGAAQPQGRVIRSENHSASHSREIADWVAAHYPAITVGTSLVYRLE